jgi:quercetin dioxygenase-like cupin family protein
VATVTRSRASRAALTEPEAGPRPDWSPVPRPGCVNVEGRVLLLREGLAVAMLKFDAEATIDEHAAPYEIDVVCLEGEGFISIEDKIWDFRRGLTLTWPAGRVHRLWTAEHSMLTLMVERPG